MSHDLQTQLAQYLGAKTTKEAKTLVIAYTANGQQASRGCDRERARKAMLSVKYGK